MFTKRELLERKQPTARDEVRLNVVFRKNLANAPGDPYLCGVTNSDRICGAVSLKVERPICQDRRVKACGSQRMTPGAGCRPAGSVAFPVGELLFEPGFAD